MDTATHNMEMMEMGEEDPETTTSDGAGGAEKKASPERREGLLERAKKGLEKVKEILLGMTMLKNREDGSIRIAKDVTSRKAEEEEFNVDDLIEEGEEVSVEIEKAKDGKKATDDRTSGHELEHPAAHVLLLPLCSPPWAELPHPPLSESMAHQIFHCGKACHQHPYVQHTHPW